MFALILFNLLAILPENTIAEAENHLWPMKIDWSNLIIWGMWPEISAWKKRTFPNFQKLDSNQNQNCDQKRNQKVEKSYFKKPYETNPNRNLRRASRLMQPK